MFKLLTKSYRVFNLSRYLVKAPTQHSIGRVIALARGGAAQFRDANSLARQSRSHRPSHQTGTHRFTLGLTLLTRIRASIVSFLSI